MDYRSAGNPEPFTLERLQRDDRPVTEAERSEAAFLLRQAKSQIGQSMGHLSQRVTRGDLAQEIETAAGYLARLQEVLLRFVLGSGGAAEEVNYDDLRRHCVTVHCNLAGLDLSNDEAAWYHHDEHHGPGGLRLHDEHDLSWDQQALTEMLEEAPE